MNNKNTTNYNYDFDEKKLVEAKTELELYLKNYEISEDLKIHCQNIINEIETLIKIKDSKNEKGIKKLLKNIKKTLKVLKDIFMAVDNTARRVNNCLDAVSNWIWEVVKKVESILFP